MYDLIMRAVLNTPWAILPEKLSAIQALLALRAAGGQVTAEDIAAATNGRRPLLPTRGAVAMIPVYGTIHQHAGMMMESSGGTATDAVSEALRQALADPGVGAVVLDVDSPGGAVSGVGELAMEIFKSRGPKPIIAVANSLMASAAYWIGSAADEIWVTPGGEVGSIGVYAAHEDVSQALEKDGIRVNLVSAGKYKVEGNQFEPLTDEARSSIQARVDAYYTMFVGAVARGRGYAEATVRNGFGEGRLVGAQEAVDAHMADRIGTLDEAIQRAGTLARRRASAQAAADDAAVKLRLQGL
jgi:signal peptide peptidase SppA